jgi:hypothetical protein
MSSEKQKGLAEIVLAYNLCRLFETHAQSQTPKSIVVAKNRKT